MDLGKSNSFDTKIPWFHKIGGYYGAGVQKDNFMIHLEAPEILRLPNFNVFQR